MSDSQGDPIVSTMLDAWGNPVQQTAQGQSTAPVSSGNANLDPNQTGHAALLTNDQQTLGFTGYQKDEDLGLYYANARFYDPLVGGFGATDPAIGDPANPITMNKFLYANGNPVVYVDPDGNCGVLTYAMPGSSFGCNLMDGMIAGVSPTDQAKLFQYREAQGKQIVADTWDSVKSTVSFGADLAVANFERQTGADFGGRDRVQQRIEGAKAYLSDVPGNLERGIVDWGRGLLKARAAGDHRQVGRATAPIAGAAYSAMIPAAPAIKGLKVVDTLTKLPDAPGPRFDPDMEAGNPAGNIAHEVKPAQASVGEEAIQESTGTPALSGGLDGEVANESFGRVTGTYSAVEPGPLPDEMAGTFAGGRYKSVVLDRDTVMFRAGTEDQPLGQFFAADPPPSASCRLV